jgi:hypothetical protein
VVKPVNLTPRTRRARLGAKWQLLDRKSTIEQRSGMFGMQTRRYLHGPGVFTMTPADTNAESAGRPDYTGHSATSSACSDSSALSILTS